jgi:hypothetical protein
LLPAGFLLCVQLRTLLRFVWAHIKEQNCSFCLIFLYDKSCSISKTVFCSWIFLSWRQNDFGAMILVQCFWCTVLSKVTLQTLFFVCPCSVTKKKLLWPLFFLFVLSRLQGRALCMMCHLPFKTVYPMKCCHNQAEMHINLRWTGSGVFCRLRLASVPSELVVHSNPFFVRSADIGWHQCPSKLKVHPNLLSVCAAYSSWHRCPSKLVGHSNPVSVCSANSSWHWCPSKYVGHCIPLFVRTANSGWHWCPWIKHGSGGARDESRLGAVGKVGRQCAWRCEWVKTGVNESNLVWLSQDWCICVKTGAWLWWGTEWVKTWSSWQSGA